MIDLWLDGVRIRSPAPKVKKLMSCMPEPDDSLECEGGAKSPDGSFRLNFAAIARTAFVNRIGRLAPTNRPTQWQLNGRQVLTVVKSISNVRNVWR